MRSGLLRHARWRSLLTPVAYALCLLPVALGHADVPKGWSPWDHLSHGDDHASFHQQAQWLKSDGAVSLEGVDAEASKAVYDELGLRAFDTRVRRVQNYRAAADVLETFLKREHSPLVRALAHWHAAHYEWKCGEFERARAHVATLGLVREWQMVGPFDNERGSGFTTVYAPESGEGGPYDGKRGSIDWRGWSERSLSLSPAHLVRPTEEALVYLRTRVRSDAAREVTLRVGSSGAYAIWINGVEVKRVDVERPFGLDQDAVTVELPWGTSDLLVKTAHTKGDWRFALRFTEADGTPITGDRLSIGPGLPQDTTPAPVTVVEKAPTLGADTILRAAAASADRDRLLGWLMGERHTHDRNAHPDREVLLRAVEADDTDAATRYLLAKTYQRDITHTAEREENRWREELEIALGMDEGLHRARIDLARYYLRRFGNLQRAESLIAPILESDPDSRPALTIRADILSRRFGSRAANSIRKPREAWLDRELMPATRLRLAREARRTGDGEEAARLIDQGLAFFGTHYDLRQARLELALARDDHATARAQLEMLSAAHPDEGWAAMKRAEYFADRREWTEALSAIDDAIAIAPDDESYHSRRGDILLHLGRKSPALDAFDRALALEVNQPKLRQYVELMRESESGLDEEFRIPIEPIVEAALAATDDTEHPARILLDNTAVEIQRDGTSTRYHQMLAKITNDQGIRDFDTYRVPYAFGEQWVKVTQARVHHANGRVEEAQIRNRAPVKREGEYPVWSSAWVDLPPLEVGDVIEIEYRQEDLSQSFFGDYFGDRVLFASVNYPRDRSTYTIVAPPERELYFNYVGVDAPVESRDDARRTWRWDVGAKEAVEWEPGMKPLQEMAPRVEVSTFRDWDAFATWYYHLIRKQFESSPEIREKVRQLTAGLETDREKIRAVYEFVVTDVRYIAWEFGVHGFKPYNASTIFTRRFGDCKDKATLICTMLDEVDIEAYPVLIYGAQGENRAAEDFTLPLVQHFNHCIAYVPDDGTGESLYVDGTAEFHGVHQLPMMDYGAKVLVVKDDGGKVDDIPWNTPEEREVTEHVKVTIAEDGSAVVEQENRFSGDYAVFMRSRFEIEAQRATILERIFAERFPGTTVEDVTMSPLDDLSGPVSLRVRLSVPNYLDLSGNTAKLPPVRDLFSSASNIGGLVTRPEREHDLNLGNPRRSQLTWEIQLPPGFRVQHVPESLGLDGEHGEYRFRTDHEGNKLKIERVLSFEKPRVRSHEYPDFKRFADAVERVREEQILLERVGEVD